MTRTKINHRGTETQRFHREGQKTGKTLLTFWFFSVQPLCLCASVVDLGRKRTTTRSRGWGEGGRRCDIIGCKAPGSNQTEGPHAQASLGPLHQKAPRRPPWQPPFH